MVHRSIRRYRREGTTLVESAFVFSIFLMFLFGIWEYGRYLMVKQLTDHASREGVRYAVVHTHDQPTPNIVQRVRDNMYGLDKNIQGMQITVYRADPATGNPDSTNSDWTSATFGEPIAVRITGSYQTILPDTLIRFVLANQRKQIPISSTNIMYSEAN